MRVKIELISTLQQSKKATAILEVFLLSSRLFDSISRMNIALRWLVLVDFVSKCCTHCLLMVLLFPYCWMLQGQHVAFTNLVVGAALVHIGLIQLCNHNMTVRLSTQTGFVVSLALGFGSVFRECAYQWHKLYPKYRSKSSRHGSKTLLPSCFKKTLPQKPSDQFKRYDQLPCIFFLNNKLILILKHNIQPTCWSLTVCL